MATPKLLPASVFSSSSKLFDVECAELFAEFLHALGLPRSVGQIYGVLYASPEALCFSQIVERLAISKGSVSQGLALLRESSAVKVIAMEGDRRDFFVPELSLRKLLSEILEVRVRTLMTENSKRIDRIELYPNLTPHQRGRVAQLKYWSTQLSRLVPALRLLLNVSAVARLPK